MLLDVNNALTSAVFVLSLPIRLLYQKQRRQYISAESPLNSPTVQSANLLLTGLFFVKIVQLREGTILHAPSFRRRQVCDVRCP